MTDSRRREAPWLVSAASGAEGAESRLRMCLGFAPRPPPANGLPRGVAGPSPCTEPRESHRELGSGESQSPGCGQRPRSRYVRSFSGCRGQVYCKVCANPPALDISSTIEGSEKYNSHCVGVQEMLDVKKIYLRHKKVENRIPYHSGNLNMKPEGPPWDADGEPFSGLRHAQVLRFGLLRF